MALLDVVVQHPVVAAATVILIATVVASIRARSIGNYPDLPWVGRKTNSFGATTVANFSSPKKTREWLEEGYYKYTKHGKSFLMPNISGKPLIIVPNDRLQAYNDQPEDVLSAWQAHYDTLACKYTFTDSDLVRIRFHEHVLTTHMPRKLKDILPTSYDELSVTMQEILGTDTANWKEVNIMKMMTKIACRVSNRTLVGLPLCRDQALLDDCVHFAEDAIRCIIVNMLLPTLLEPIMNLVALPNWYHYFKVRKMIAPVIEKRIADIEAEASHPHTKHDIPDDYITWHIRTARAEGKLWALDISWTVRCLLALEFATIHTTLITGSNAILDIFSSKTDIQASLREEAERVFGESSNNTTHISAENEKGIWSKQNLAKLLRTDSALRESMRIGDFASLNARKVVHPNGMYDPVENFTAPYGSSVAVLAYNRHHDPDVYSDPNTFDPYRFSRPREEFAAAAEREGEKLEGKAREEWLRLQNYSMTSVGKDNMAFGMGRHACPGRFFAQQELKLLVAFLVMHYDVEPLPERPQNINMGGSGAPPSNATIKVRRRVAKA
ncbi:hypothetical protein CBER1_09225 [Cercospora berteroae]|uniref:Cytochrome P450 n=1 Tax=Cercospora berteroae TaxID=357750 RepID=A0A2S6BVI9_9PEZI|nr:hypothetical protein CBER1_09225 [Cercospora berteroae]